MTMCEAEKKVLEKREERLSLSSLEEKSY